MLRDLVGNPFRPLPPRNRRHAELWRTELQSCLAWNDGTIPKLARAIHEERAFDRMPILADALEDAGCTNADVLEHCRQPGTHIRGCWVIDLLRSLAPG